MAKKRSRTERQQRHAARVDRMRGRQAERHRQQGNEKRYREALRLYRQSIFQAMLCELADVQGYDPYAEWVVCDRCGLLQVYRSDEGGDETQIHELIETCKGFEGVGCGSETCITVNRYLDEAA